MPNRLSADQALRRLREGNARSVRDQAQGPKTHSDLRLSLALEQNPFAVIVGCADSRVVPEVIFDQGLGDLFVIRVAGNVANDSTIGSVEFAVANIDVRLVLVIGHTNCGAVTAAMETSAREGNLGRLMTHIDPALGAGATLAANIRANARRQAAQMMRRSPLLQAVDGLQVAAAYYDLATGEVELLEAVD
jgi:carbonic anhydrase